MGFLVEISDEHDPRGRMQRRLLPWLGRQDWELQELIDWLQGHYLPPVGHEEEPYLWMLRGLPLGSQRHAAQTELATRVARLLGAMPDGRPVAKRPDQVMYNLLMLAAGLSCQAQLAEPLYQLFQQGELVGAWQGCSLRIALRAALIHNQSDSRMQPHWEAMLVGALHPLLPGNPYDGFEGVLWMPPAGKPPGEPALEALGMALCRIADYIDKTHYSERRPRFRKLLDRIQTTYPGLPWPLDLLHQADRYDWPRWAVLCLPSLCIEIGTTEPEGGTTFLIWTEIAKCIPGLSRIEGRIYCNEVVPVRLDADSLELLKFIGPEIEYSRLLDPFPSDASVLQGNKKTMAGIQAVLAFSRPQAAQWVQQVRMSI